MELRKHTRRDFLRLTGLSAAGVIVAACAGETPTAQPTAEATTAATLEATVEATETTEAIATLEEATAEATATTETEGAAVTPGKYQESPMLAERVANGELPPVEERLPEEPRVCEIIGEIGQYGGTLTTATLSQNLYGGDSQMAMDRPTMLRIGHDGGHAVEFILKDWEFSEDFTTITCYMRKGMKWSDGEPSAGDLLPLGRGAHEAGYRRRLYLQVHVRQAAAFMGVGEYGALVWLLG